MDRDQECELKKTEDIRKNMRYKGSNCRLLIILLSSKYARHSIICTIMWVDALHILPAMSPIMGIKKAGKNIKYDLQRP
ncbi:hypothetical protein SAMN04489723_10522 [Algoriphagus aquimarinus]|uniref:Uncharacterized protein n=1 Tax=Algoriphagus aquimarinus TaxID=237018 RepID=A0A1I0YSD1_9BACT|nr:hypothetical protein SAMN04489723_10522 [Algoriphagus aquimarinus]